MGPLTEQVESERLQDYCGDAHSVEEAIQGRPRRGEGLLPLQALLQEVRGGVLLLGPLGEEKDQDDKLVILLQGMEGQELLGRGQLRPF